MCKGPGGRNLPGVLEEQRGLHSWSRVRSPCLAGLVGLPQGWSKTFQREWYQKLTFFFAPNTVWFT